MVDKKITDLPAASTVVSTDVLEVTTDPAGTPVSEKLTVEQIGVGWSGQYRVNTVATTGATETLSADYEGHDITMDEACTFTFSSPTEDGHTFVLFLAGAFTPTFPASVDWESATAPTYATPTLYVFTTTDGGTTWLGSMIGSGYG